MNIVGTSEQVPPLRLVGIVRKLEEAVYESLLKAAISELTKKYPEGWIEDAMRWQGKTN